MREALEAGTSDKLDLEMLFFGGKQRLRSTCLSMISTRSR